MTLFSIYRIRVGQDVDILGHCLPGTTPAEVVVIDRDTGTYQTRLVCSESDNPDGTGIRVALNHEGLTPNDWTP